jgi:hypothetical protein
MTTERAKTGQVAEILANRARGHRTLSPEAEARLDALVRGRVNDLLDSWAKIAKAHVGARLIYQPFENADGPPLLRTPLDPELATLNVDERKFKAPRSLRDVEPSVNLLLKRLDGTDIETSSEEDA